MPLAHGDGAAEPANGSSHRPSQGCVTIPSTIGGMYPAPALPPIETCVPFAGGMSVECWATGGTGALSASGYRTSQPVQIVVGPDLRASVTHITTRPSLPPPREWYIYFVFASTSGGGVGSIRPCSEYWPLYCLLC